LEEFMSGKILPESGVASRGKIGFAGGEDSVDSVRQTEVEMAGVVQFLRHALDCFRSGADRDGLAELGAGFSPVVHGFRERTIESKKEIV
jgi:hypothetical protein